MVKRGTSVHLLPASSETHVGLCIPQLHQVESCCYYNISMFCFFTHTHTHLAIVTKSLWTCYLAMHWKIWYSNFTQLLKNVFSRQDDIVAACRLLLQHRIPWEILIAPHLNWAIVHMHANTEWCSRLVPDERQPVFMPCAVQSPSSASVHRFASK